MSVNVVDKSTGSVTKVAGNTNNAEVGNLSSLTTTDKSCIVGALNEVNDKVNSYHFSVVDGKLCVTYKKTV